MESLPTFTVIAPEVGHTLAKVLRSHLHESLPSWKEVRAYIEGRRVKVGDSICTDSARRLKEGEVVEFLAKPQPSHRTATPEGLPIRHLDDHVVVVEKPSGINTVRHPSELEWSEQRKGLVPTLQDITQWAVAQRLNRPSRSLPPLRIVHRLDKETSGLIVFARSALGERELGLQFRQHTVVRRYLALVSGSLGSQTIVSHLVKDRGDGRRGSTSLPKVGKRAVTHVEVEERFRGCTLMSCRLETGRTHQIRIHLSEKGHPVCGDKVYCRKPNGDVLKDASQAPRLALHAIELGFLHPVHHTSLHWMMPLPKDLQHLMEQVRKKS